VRSVKVASILFCHALFLLRLLAVSARAADMTYAAVDLYRMDVPSSFDGYFYQLPAVIATGGQVAANGVMPGNQQHAVLWNAPLGDFADLNPTNLAGFTKSNVFATNGLQQVGAGSGPFATGGFNHALLWSGTSDSAIDLNPSNLGFVIESYANGVANGQQVGYAYGPGTGNQNHAVRWTGTAASALDLNPAGFFDSRAFGTDGIRQVGAGAGNATGGIDHALLWNGTAEEFVDLNPTNLTGYDSSRAVGVSGNWQVGTAKGPTTGDQDHAVLWDGTPDSAVDLHPSADFMRSYAIATNGTLQVGFGLDVNYDSRALLWSGSASSFIDLATILPSEFFNSAATAIDSDGNVFGVGSASDGAHAIEWVPVPEPTSLALAVLGAYCAAAVLGSSRRLNRPPR